MMLMLIILFVVSAMGMGLCVAFIAFVRLPSLKVSTLLLTGLLIYDVFWVFFSSYIFNANVMVKVTNTEALSDNLSSNFDDRIIYHRQIIIT